MSPTVRDVVHSFLAEQGVTKIFGNPGSTEMRFFRNWPEGLDYVLAPQEASVLAMADGYAQAKGQVGVAMVHSAAGLGHALGSLYTAERNQTPLVVLAGLQTRALLANEPYLFARSAAEFPQPYVKFSIEPATAADVPAAIAQAFFMAQQAPA
ncbi:thiamine pyrophosphate-binding protein [Arthrobacter sp. GMC3]|uniref:thiamine pyrophosphate-binding protein n=1 Tax=Arthrobacter sp. GMC3 TaxID=2058894 RepID=UPI0015E2D556|nr:thiamine pyrophosphate-binding protein [Arthrobacter sp. GMC3]